MLLIFSFIGVSLLLLSYMYYNNYNNYNNQNQDIKTFLLADSVDDDYI